MRDQIFDIAIIGLACRFPGANSIEEYWKNLQDGRESITFFSEEELLAANVDSSLLKNPDYVRAAPIIDDVDKFDAGFFDYAPREARIMDPQHRLMLQTAWHAFEDAGYDCESLDIPVAVFAGSGGVVSSYFADQLRNGVDAPGSTGSLEHLGNDKDFIATRLSYKLNLTGPSVTVQTACSTSMVAVHLACQSLLRGESDMALAGAATVRCPHHEGYLARKGDILSSDGHCRAFDASADGTLFGSGVGAVLLKPLDKAVTDGDHIYAVIKSTAINNDGRNKISYTASSVGGQAQAMVEAMSLSGVTPDQVGMIECHGTGTIVGDPLEIQALTLAFNHCQVQGQEFCAIGSVKTNIGHLEQASGIASLIKAALCIERGQLVPSLNFKRQNPKARLKKSPFYVNTEFKKWETGNDTPRIACVNSLGLGGTNAFAVLQQAPARASTALDSRELQILTLSAKSQPALATRTKQLLSLLESDKSPDFSDLCHTLNVGRTAFANRFSILARSGTEAAQALRKRIADKEALGPVDISDPAPVVFLFPGQGSQYQGMARELYSVHPVFRSTIDCCSALLADELDTPLTDIIFAETGDPRIHQTIFAQPALYAVGVALDRLWRSWGIKPNAVMGHSVGEYAAATSAGVVSVEDGIRLIAARGRLMQSLPSGGAMLSILATQTVVEQILADSGGGDASIAGINAANSTVVSGTEQALHSISEQCRLKEITCKRLDVSHGFHSKLLDPILDEFEAVAEQFSYNRPKIGLLSNLTGKVTYQAPDAVYWREHARQPVRFAACARAVQEFGASVYIEMGPGDTLLKMTRANKLSGSNLAWLPSLKRGASDWETMLNSLSVIYDRGAAINWRGFSAPFSRSRVALPTYPFQGEHYWYEKNTRLPAPQSVTPQEHPFLGRPEIGPKGEVVYHITYDLERFGFLDHHRIYGMAVLPFAAALEAILVAGKQYFEGPATLENVRYQTALIVEHRAVEIALVAQSDDRVAFEVTSRPENASGTAQTHIVGMLVRGSGDALSNDIFVPDEFKDSPQAIDTDLYYERVNRTGLNYGPLFRNSIKGLWRQGNDLISHVSLHEDLNPHAYDIHPALLDGCLHIFPALAKEYGDFSDTSLFEGVGYLPVGIERFVLTAPALGPLWTRARCREALSGRMVLDIELYDTYGAPIGLLGGLEVRKLNYDAVRPIDYLPHAYELAWTELPAITEPQEQSIKPVGWLILPDKQGVANVLIELLIARGDNVAVLDIDSFERGSSQDWQTSIQGACSSLTLPLEKVVFLSALDTPAYVDLNPEVLLQGEKLVGQDALLMLQALGVDDMPNARAWFVTRNAVNAHTSSDMCFPTNPLQSTLWGLGRTVAQEMPNLWGGLIDLPEMPTAPFQLDAVALLKELDSTSAPDQIALRPEGRYGPRLIRIPKIEAGKVVTVTKSASYLVSGGLGGLGLRVAKWLLETYSVSNIVLMGRSLPSSGAAEAIAELEAAGCRVTVAQADVSSEADVARIMDQIRRELPPLRGIVHCAGGLDDGILANMDWDKFTGVTHPKSLGAWLLHEHTQDQPLDFFILFSSILSLMGSAGQSNYAAGNAFLDGLAAARHQQNLPATVVNWGPWSDVGMAIVSGVRGEKIWERRGIEYIPPDLGIEYLDIALRQNLSQIAVVMTDWDIFAGQFKTVPPLYSALVRRSLPVANVSKNTTISSGSLLDMPAEKRKSTLVNIIKHEVALVLGLKSNQIKPDQTLDELGLDSLMTIDLINRLDNALPVKVPKAALVQAVSIDALVSSTLQAFDGSDNATADKSSGVRSSLIIRQARPEAKIKLLCFAFAGGGPGSYSEWADNLSSSFEVAAIHLPGRGSRLDEPAYTRISETVADLIPEILPYLDRPFALFGHCVGAMLMYEVAKHLSSQHDLHAVHLFASGAAAPDLYTIPSHYKAPDEQLLVLLKLVDFAATEGLVKDAELRALAFPALRADLEAAALYNEELDSKVTTLSTPITAFGGWEDMYASPNGVDGWRRFTSKPFDIVMCTGNHYFLETERKAILAVIGSTLEAHLEGRFSDYAALFSGNGVDQIWQQANAKPKIQNSPQKYRASQPAWLNAKAETKNAAAPVLICFPPAWTDGLGVDSWATSVPGGLEVVEIVYPGHGSLIEQPPIADLRVLAQGVFEQLTPWFGRKLIFFGHCMGGIVAYEVARLLREHNRLELVHLFVSAVTSPKTFVYPWVHLQSDEKIRELMLTINYPFLDRLILGENDSQYKQWQALIRADFEAQASYKFVLGEPLDVPITAIATLEDEWTSPTSVRLWGNYTRAHFRQFQQTGSHFNLPADISAYLDIICNVLKEEEANVA